jgi:DHA1 family bicyclomycin/chloramphenicol resistance-like MFS transporter
LKPSFVITLGVLTGMSALTIDISLPAVPSMAIALATSLSKGQQIVGVFMAGMACGQIPAGLISDRVGRLPVLYCGMILFAIAAVASASANDIDLLLIARFIQGFGAASAIVLARAIVRDVASGKEAAKLMSLMTMIFTAAPVIAPSFGALLVAQWGWRAPLIAIAVLGILVLFAIRGNLHETHSGNSAQHPVRQLVSSFAEFFSHRQSVFGLLLIIIPPAGFMSMIALAASLIVEIYGYSITQFGLIFAAAGGSILLGAASNRLLVTRLASMQIIAIGITLMGLSSAQLLFIAWLGRAPLAWIWGCVCIYMFTIALTMPNATVIALDPLPKIAGVASSIIGTLQNIFGASGALLGAAIYDGSVRNTVIILGSAGTLTVLVFLLRPLIMRGAIVHHPQELARD